MAIEQSHKSHNTSTHILSTQLENRMHISVTNWCILGHGRSALWDLWNWLIWLHVTHGNLTQRTPIALTMMGGNLSKLTHCDQLTGIRRRYRRILLLVDAWRILLWIATIEGCLAIVLQLFLRLVVCLVKIWNDDIPSKINYRSITTAFLDQNLSSLYHNGYEYYSKAA